ncbi:hypothetical protein BJ742DRAFT_430292 [Cladochytrium replicatum]|nr:hypothetical protein BJ742DRAFT_430292 [Cladochytrium replicatum]
MHTLIALVIILGAAPFIQAHGVVTAVNGANGVVGTGFGVDPTTPRDGSRRNPFQRDSTRTNTGGCGNTVQSGHLLVATELQKQVALGKGQLPSTDATGVLRLTYHQVNGDGAGPHTLELDTTAVGQAFVPGPTATVPVPGRRGRSRARAEDFQMLIQIPPGTKCTGGPNADACLLRLRNPNRSQFGGCVAFQMGNSTAVANTPATAVNTSEDDDEEDDE